MKTKAIITAILLIAVCVFAQDKPKNDSSFSYTAPISDIQIERCKAHGKHFNLIIEIEAEDGKRERYKMCQSDYYRAQIQMLRNAGVDMEVIK